MTVKEYREKHPNCKFCKYGQVRGYDFGTYCSVRKKASILPRAIFCPLFTVEEDKYL